MKATARSQEVDTIAQLLVTTFKAPKYLPLFRKASWHLSLVTISSCARVALQKKVPVSYLVVALRCELKKVGK